MDLTLQQLFLLFDAAALSVLITDPQSRIVEVNPQFTLSTGYEPHEILGETPSFLSSHIHDHDFYNHLWTELVAGRTWSGTIVNQHKDGSMLPCSSTIHPHIDSSGQLLGYIGLFRIVGAVFPSIHSVDVAAVLESDANVVAVAELEEICRSLYAANQRLEEQHLQLMELSRTDPLTGVANRRRFNEFYEQEWKRALRHNEPMSLVMIDIDYFKNFNDLYGHPAGDAALRDVANALTRSVSRSTDLVARLGGEEFAVILPDTHAAGAAIVAERLRASVEALEVRHQMHTHKVGEEVLTISLGIDTRYPKPDEDQWILMQRADFALYSAKRAGRNGWRAASPLLTGDQAPPV